MPSRKRLKGQARKAERPFSGRPRGVANAAATATATAGNPCDHGRPANRGRACNRYLGVFFETLVSKTSISKEERLSNSASANQFLNTTVHVAFEEAYEESPEALDDPEKRNLIKRFLLSEGAVYLLEPELSYEARALALAFMMVDACDPTDDNCAIMAGAGDPFDGSLRRKDIAEGCNVALARFFAKRIPCSCLDETYKSMKASTPRTGVCWNCKERRAVVDLFVCTGCEYFQYCSEACHREQWHCGGHKYQCKYFCQRNLGILV